MTVMRLNPFGAGSNFDLPILWILPAQIILPLLFACYQYRTCPTIQQIGAYFWTLAMIAGFGMIADLCVMTEIDRVYRFALIQDGWLVHFNAFTLGFMNILAMISAVNLMQAEQMSSFADAKVAEAQLGRLKAVKVDPETQNKWEKAASHAEAQADGRSLRSTMTNLKAISLQDPSQTLTGPAVSVPREMPKRTPENSGDAGSLASLLDRIGDEPAAIEGEDAGEYIPPAKQPVEAPKPEPTFEPQFDPLEIAALDEKVDTKESVSTGMMGSFRPTSQSSKTVTPSEPFATATSQASPQATAEAASQPSVQPQVSAQAAVNAPSSLDSPTASNTRLQAMKRRNTSTFTKLQSLSASGTGSLTPQVRDTTPQAEPDSLKSLLDRLDDDHVQEPAQALTPPVELVLDTVFKEDGHLEVTVASSSSSSAMDSIAVATPDSTGAIPSAAVQAALAKAKEMAALEAAAAAQEATKEATKITEATASGNHSSLSDRLTASAAAEAPSLANLLDTAESNAADEDQEEEGEALFAGGVDKDIDNLFSDLAPPEAQKEVASAESVSFASDQAEDPFAKTVEVELSPLLSAPLETAQDGEGELTNETAPEEQEEEEPTGLFEGGVDSDIDDIFSELAPPEAQKEVGQAFTKSEDVDPDVASMISGLSAAAPDRDALAAALESKSEPLTQAAEDIEASDDEESGGTLFGAGVDSDIDNIFSELAPPEALKEVKDVLKPRATAAAKVEDFSPPEVQVEAEAESEQEEGLFGETLGEDLDNLFSELTDDKQLEVSPETLAKVKGTIVEAESAAKAETAAKAEAKPPSPRSTGDMPAMTAEQAEQVKAKVESAAEEKPATEEKAAAKTEDKKDSDAKGPNYKEVKEFGRLSTRSGSLKSAPETVGTMKTIGKLLLDVKAVENIIKSGENRKIGSGLSTAKVISAARGEGIKQILVTIDSYEGVAGSLIVGHDGLVIASTVTGSDKDMLGALSTALLSTSNLATKKLEIGKLKQMVLLTKLTTDDGKEIFKSTLLTDVEVGILAVFIEQTDLSKIDGLLETIQKTIHGT